MVLLCTFLPTSDGEHLPVCLWAICTSWEARLLSSSAHLEAGSLITELQVFFMCSGY